MGRKFVGTRWLPRLGAALVAVVMVAATARAQEENRITGHIVDATDNAPIPSAQVIVSGTTLGAQTTDSGRFTLRVPPDAKSFVIRRIGYLAQTIPITPGKTDYVVALQKDVLRLETQVVTGVVTSVSSQNSANAVSVVSTQDLNQVPAPTVENNIQGKIPGAVIESNNSGAPGGGMQIQVRGITSINANAAPLYVVDGVVMDNETINPDINAITGAGGGTTGPGGTGVAVGNAPSMEDNGVNRIADLNPDDIESVEVLKGASASAIYGSHANAGVVIITTKKGTAGKPKWDVSNQVGHYAIMNEYPIRKFPTLASAQAWYNNDKNPTTGAAGIAANNATIAGEYAGPQNYQTELFGNSQASYQTNVSVSGTQGATQYYLSGLSKYDNGVMNNTGYNKQSVRSNVTQQFSSALSVTANLNFVHDVTRDGVTGNDNIGISPYNVFSQTPQFLGLNQLKPDGTYPLNPFGPANPFADAAEIATPQAVSRFIGGGTVNWQPWKTEHQSLQVNLVGGADFTGMSAQLYAPPTLQVEQRNPNGLPGTAVSNTATIDYINYSINLIHHYTGLSWLDASTSAGFTRERRDLNNPVTVGQNLLSGVQAQTAGTVTNSFYYRTAERDQSYYAQEQLLLLDSRLTVTGGVDLMRSTNDGDINKFYAFPHYAASYRLPQFASFLDELKLRGAYGASGNLAPYGSRYNVLNQTLFSQTNGIAFSSNLGDPNIQPESETEMETGFDATMFHSRAQFTFTVYQKRLTNLLLQAGVAPSFGWQTQYTNGGEFTNQGIELSLQVEPIQLSNGLAWNSTVTVYRNYSAVNALPGNKPFIAGNSFGFGADGYLAVGRSVSDMANTGTVLPNGLFQQSGDFQPGIVTDLGNEITFKGFRVYGLLDWSRGGNVLNLTDLYFDTGPQLYGDSTYGANRFAQFGVGTPYVQPASWLFVRELTLSYGLPASVVKDIGFNRIASARLSLTGYNLWGIFSYRGLDPEVSVNGNQQITRAQDITPYPPARNFFLGLDLGL